jgi:hypothetical protein
MYACGSIQGTVCNYCSEFESERMSEYVSPKTMVSMLLSSHTIILFFSVLLPFFILFIFNLFVLNFLVCRGCKHPQIKSKYSVKLSKVAMRKKPSQTPSLPGEAAAAPIEAEKKNKNSAEDTKLAQSAPVAHADRHGDPLGAARLAERSSVAQGNDLRTKVSNLLESKQMTINTIPIIKVISYMFSYIICNVH